MECENQLSALNIPMAGKLRTSAVQRGIWVIHSVADISPAFRAALIPLHPPPPPSRPHLDITTPLHPFLSHRALSLPTDPQWTLHSPHLEFYVTCCLCNLLARIDPHFFKRTDAACTHTLMHENTGCAGTRGQALGQSDRRAES